MSLLSTETLVNTFAVFHLILGVVPREADLPIAVDAGAFKHVKGIRAFLKNIEVLFGDAAHNVYIYIYMLISII